MHPRNIHNAPYDFEALVKANPELSSFVITNRSEKDTIDFFDEKAVLALNKALLTHHYGIKYWEIPADYLCPPVPGRADYILHALDLLAGDYGKRLPKSKAITCLDIGTGANLIYPILGNKLQNWKFVASETDQTAFTNAKKIVKENNLYDSIELRKQKDTKSFFKHIIRDQELYALSFCNPPFYGSAEEARNGSNRKLQSLKSPTTKNNFGGQSNELWCAGGERQFIKNMIIESQEYRHQCLWFTALISAHKNVSILEREFQYIDGEEYRIIPMEQGNKSSRFIAWTFFTEKQRRKFVEMVTL